MPTNAVDEPGEPSRRRDPRGVPGRARFLDSAELAQLRSEQEDVLSRAQASEHGIDHRTIRRRVAADQWQTVGPAVLVLHNGPLSMQQQRWAGVLHAGAGAALAGLTALQAAGRTGSRPT